jgi:hypothetical protein
MYYEHTYISYPFIQFVIAVYVFADKVKTIHLVIFLCLSILSQIHWVSMLSSWFLKRDSYYPICSQVLIKMVAVNGLAIICCFS